LRLGAFKRIVKFERVNTLTSIAMKSIIVILLFAATTMVAQSTEQSPCAVYKQVIKSRNISALDSLIDAHASSSSLFDLKLLRAHAISKIYRIKIEHSQGL